MNYKKHYDLLIKKRQQFPLSKDKTFSTYVYCETHHIIPKCLGGTNDKTNLVNLTAREHYVAHLLLAKIYQTDKSVYYRLCKAISFFKTNSKNGKERISSLQKKFNSRLFEKMVMLGNKAKKTKACSGKNAWAYNRKWITNDVENMFLKIEDAQKFLSEHPDWRFGQKFAHRIASKEAIQARINGRLKSKKHNKHKKTKIVFSEQHRKKLQEHCAKIGKLNKGKSWIHNSEGKNKLVFLNDKKSLPNSWLKGKFIKKQK